MEAAVVHLPEDSPLLIFLATLDLQEGLPARRREPAARPQDRPERHRGPFRSGVLPSAPGPKWSAAVLQTTHGAGVVERINTLLNDVADSNTATATIMPKWAAHSSDRPGPVGDALA